MSKCEAKGSQAKNSDNELRFRLFFHRSNKCRGNKLEKNLMHFVCRELKTMSGRQRKVRDVGRKISE